MVTAVAPPISSYCICFCFCSLLLFVGRGGANCGVGVGNYGARVQSRPTYMSTCPHTTYNTPRVLNGALMLARQRLLKLLFICHFPDPICLKLLYICHFPDLICFNGNGIVLSHPGACNTPVPVCG